MKQAQMMQANLQKAQNELGNIEVEGSASNGQVKITMTCKNEIRKVFIDESLMQDKELLEDLILVALKDTQAKIEATTSTPTIPLYSLCLNTKWLAHCRPEFLQRFPVGTQDQLPLGEADNHGEIHRCGVRLR